MNKPLVSVGIAAYNRVGELKKVIDCMINQTYKNLEIIISNDSDDANISREIDVMCVRFMKEDKRIKYINHNRNLGGMGRINYQYLLNEAKADYFMWGPDEENWDKKFIEKCMDKFIEDNSLELVFSKCKLFSKKRNSFNEYQSLVDFDKFQHLEKSKIVSLYLLLSHSFHLETIVYGLWKKQKLKESIKVLNESIESYKNYEFNGRPIPADPVWVTYILLNTRMYQIPETLFFRTCPNHVPSSLRCKVNGIKEKIMNVFNFSRYKGIYDYNILSLKMIKDMLDSERIEDKRIRRTLNLKKYLFMLPVEIRNFIIFLIASSILNKEKLKN